MAAITKSKTTYKQWDLEIRGSTTTKYPSRLELVRSRTGDRNPNYKSLISDRKDATTDLTAQEETFTRSIGKTDGTYLDWNGSELVYVDFVDTFQGHRPAKTVFSFPGEIIAEAQASARAAAYQRVRRLQTPFETLTFLAEFGEVVSLLRNPLGSAVKLTNALVHQRGIIKSTAKAWLEYRFAILPLISDIKEILSIMDTKKRDISRKSFRVFGTASRASTETLTNGSDYGVYNEWLSTIKYTSESIIRVGVDIEMLDKSTEYTAIALDTVNDLNSIAVTAWEEIPFSFLVDYFINIGDLIASGTAGVSAISWTSESNIKLSEHRQDLQRVWSDTGTTTIKNVTPWKSVYSLREVSRSGGQLEIPPAVVTLPGSNVRYANIAALLAILSNSKR